MDNIKKLKDIILELNEVTDAEHIKSISHLNNQLG